jgi:phage repressor protein C with HTH and peptisase S24 domain
MDKRMSKAKKFIRWSPERTLCFYVQIGFNPSKYKKAKKSQRTDDSDLWLFIVRLISPPTRELVSYNRFPHRQQQSGKENVLNGRRSWQCGHL